jgi:nucleolar protein 4
MAISNAPELNIPSNLLGRGSNSTYILMTADPTVAAVPAKDPGTHTKTTLFVRNVPFNATDADFESFFSFFGPLRSCFLIKPEAGNDEVQEKKVNKGFGFVHFAEASDANSALETLKTKKFNNRRLKAELALRKHVKQDQVFTKSAKVISRKPETISSPFLELVLENCTKLPDRKQLYKKIRKAGQVQDMALTEPNIILVTFPSPSEAQKAARGLQGHVFKGFKIAINIIPHDVKAHRLIVRNLPFSISVADMESVFGKFGSLALDRVVLGKKQNGSPAGYAFVQFLKQEDAAKALESVTNSEISGRPVAVDWALPKKQYVTIVSEAKVDTQGDTKIDDPAKPESEQVVEPGVEKPVAIEEEVSDQDDEDESSGSDDVGESASIDRTVFIRNLGFDAEEHSLEQALSCFGRVVSCKLVKNETTGLGKGTAFVEFASASSAKAAISAKPINSDELAFLSKEQNESRSTTLVDPDALRIGEGTFAPIHSGRQLIILPAVDRKTAKKLQDQSSESFDKRHLSLIKESLISKFPRLYTKQQIDERNDAVKERLRLLKRDQNLFISPTRLSLRHLPVSVDERALKVFIKETLAAAAAPKTRIVQVKIIRDANDKRKRSKGFGFCQLDDSSAALSFVHYLVANPGRWKALGASSTIPMIEFATEKATVVASREKRLRDTTGDVKRKKARK